MSKSYSAKDCAVILLNYCNPYDTVNCLRALAAMPEQPRQVIVVDNNSFDDSVALIMRELEAFACHSLVREKDICKLHAPTGTRHILVTRAVNDGFSAGNNVGIKLALRDQMCQAVWLLNTDTLPKPEALSALCRRMSEGDSPCIVGSSLIYAYDRQTVQTFAGGRLNRYLGTTTFYGEGIEFNQAFCSYEQKHVEQQLDFIVGASMLIPRTIFEKIGLLDEKFFLYYEDVEFCVRAHRAGFACAWAPNSIVYHKEGGTTGARSGVHSRKPTRAAWIDYLCLRNRVYLMRKYYPKLLGLVVSSYFGVMLNRLRRGQAKRLLLVCRAAWDGLRGHMVHPDSNVIAK